MFIRTAVLAFVVCCLTQPGLAVTRSWTGATSASWSEPTNWSPAGTPAAADQLVFPVGAARTVMTNDLPSGSSVGAMDFRTGYTLNGNPLTLTGNLTFDQSTYPNFVCNVDLTLGASVRLGEAITSRYLGAIDVNGHTLTIGSYNTSLEGALNGTGSIVVQGAGVLLDGSGTFDGTITGVVNVAGSLPDADIVGGLSGSGTVGAVTASQPLRPGYKNPAYTDDPHTIGNLQTGSLTINEWLLMDLVPGGVSDQLQVTGSVTLGGAWLTVSVPSGSPASGQTFTLIDNDGTDAVSGTFANLAEGASITVSGAALTISYIGGDGNDVVLTAVTATKSWTGASSALWSDPANWSPAGVPTPGEALIFPAGATRTVMTNDLPAGTSVGAMDFRVGYTLNGNRLTLTDDLTFDQSTYPNFVCNVDLTLGASVRLGEAITSRYLGAIDVNGHTLTIGTYNTSLEGALNGTGAIVVEGAGALLDGSGTFDGTISGIVNVAGSLPDADIVGGLSGNGTVGAVTTTQPLRPGYKNPPYSDDPHTIGTLQTGSLTVNERLLMDLVPGGASDRLQVTGSVTLGGGSWLTVSVPSGSPGSGQSFTLIDNDGTDAVSGTFANLAEGASVIISGASLTITYVGGDGNDVVLGTVSSTKNWTGASSALWSDPANWSPAGVPAAAEALLFPAGASNTVMTNDLPAGTSVGAMDFRTGYTLNGNALTLTGDLTFDQSTYPNFVCNVDLTLGASVRLGEAITSRYLGAIDVNGQTLTVGSYNTSLEGALNGSGSIVVEGAGVSIGSSGTFSGTIAGNVDVAGSLPNATIVGGLTGNGTVAAVTTTANLHPGAKNPAFSDDPHTIGTLQTQSLIVDGPLLLDLLGDGTSDQVQVTGTVTLGGQQLRLSVPNGSPAAGQTFLVIDNDGTDAVDGTFEGLDEAGVKSLAPWKFRITYLGGDGNDVVLTTIEETEVAPAQNAATTQFGEPATFTATVTAPVSVPNGTVTFTDNGKFVKALPLVAGTATFETVLEPGLHTVAATYEGTPVFTASSAALSHEVRRGKTTSQLTASSTSIVYGDPLPLSVSVRPVAPASGTPTGSVTLKDAGATVGTAVLNGGDASLAAILLEAGTYTVGAFYTGDDRFEPSDSSFAVTVRKAATVIDATVADGGAGVLLDIHVSASNRADLPVPGIVTVTLNDTVVAEQLVTGGPAVIALGALPTGQHQFAVSYAGSTNFEPAATTLVHVVGQPQVSVRDVAVLEGDSGEKSVAVSVELSTMTADTVTVAYTTAGNTAAEGSDYRRASGMLTFAPGETTKVISVQVAGDASVEGDEKLEVRLETPVNAVLGQSTGIVTIVNDDLTYRAKLGLVYSTPATGALTLDLYTPSEGAGPFPLILWIPGTTAYDASGVPTPALRATSRGYAVAMARYRSPNVARFPAQLDDLRNAIRWLRGNATQYQLDGERFAVWGSSAGAHLASLLGTTNDVLAAGAISPEVQAVVAWGGASDLLRLQADAGTAACPASFDSRTSPQSTLLGCALQTCQQAATSASPLSFVTPDDPPFLLLHGRGDCVIPLAQSARLYEALSAAGVEATLRIVDGGAPSTWASPQPVTDVEAFLDAELKPGHKKRRAVR